MQMQYSDQLAADHFDAAQAIYDSMQDAINTSCGTTDGIVSLQTSDQSAECAAQVNSLLAHYNYNMELGREGIAHAIQQNIQTYLDSNSCNGLSQNGTGPDGAALTALLTATIEQTPDIIPYNKNLCFLENVVDNFKAQINNISDESILTSVQDVVTNLFVTTPSAGGNGTMGDGSSIAPLTQERQNTILTYAKGVIQDKWHQITANNTPSLSTLLSGSLQGASATFNDLVYSDGIDTVLQFFLNGADLRSVYDATHAIYPKRNDFAAALETNPNIAYTRNPDTQALDM